MTDSTEIITKLPELPVIEIVDDLIQVYKEFMVIRAALQLGLFDWMAEHGSATIDEISTGTGIRQEFMASLMGMLFYLDLVRRNDEKYGLSPAANLHFVKKSLLYQGDVILSLSTEETPWTCFSEYLTHPEEKGTFEPRNPHALASQAEEEIRGMVRNITIVISRWQGFADATQFLELGCGHGLYAIAACQVNPSLKATVYQPPGSSLLQENIRRFGMETRITACSNLTEIPDATSDIVLASQFLYPVQGNLKEVVGQISAILRGGGLFVSNHWFAHDAEGTGSQGLYELELGMHNRYEQMSDPEFFTRICSEAGLSFFQTGMMRSRYGQSTVQMATRGGK